jgi:hypothetical protein
MIAMFERKGKEGYGQLVYFMVPASTAISVSASGALSKRLRIKHLIKEAN